MTKLSAEAYAIIEGRHSDPFHYLGLHTEGDQSVVRAFLPEASNVEAIGEHGETAPLARIHDAGLFAGALPNGSKRYQLRARFGENVVDLDDPYRFPPVLSDFDLYLLGEGTHQRIYDKLGAHPMTLDGVRRRGLRGAGAECAGASAWSAISISGMRGGIRCGCAASAIGSCSCRMPAPAITTSSTSSDRDGQHLPLKSDPMAFAAEMRPSTASIVLDETKLPHPQPGAIRHQRARRADVDLRGPSRLVAAQGRQRMAELSRPRRTASGLCQGSRLYPCRVSARQRASVRRLVGLSADRPVRADQPVRHAGGFCRAGRCLPSRRHRRDARLGARAFSRRSARPRPFRRHRALRARQSAAGPSSRLGHADLQLRPHRSGQFPGVERAVLAGALRHRRPARRCGRLDALSRLQPARRRLDSEQVWRPGKSRGHRLPAPLQHRTVRALSAGHHGRGRIDRMAAGVASGRIWRARLRLQMEHGLDARHAELHRQGSDPPQASSRRHPVRPALRVFGKFHPAAVA